VRGAKWKEAQQESSKCFRKISLQRQIVYETPVSWRTEVVNSYAFGHVHPPGESKSNPLRNLAFNFVKS